MNLPGRTYLNSDGLLFLLNVFILDCHDLFGCLAVLAADIERDGKYDDGAFDDALNIGVNADQVHNVLKEADDECSRDSSHDCTDTAGEGNTAQDNRSNGIAVHSPFYATSLAHRIARIGAARRKRYTVAAARSLAGSERE